MAIIPDTPFVLVDGSSYLFRAYHALPPLTNSKGQPTGAIYGVINMLKKIMGEYKPQHMAMVFDSKEKNFRHALYEPYKANRVVMPDELQCQIAPLHALIKAMGIPLIIMPGVEADDVIGTLAKQATTAGLFTLISTGDKDFTQLVSDEHLVLINTMSNTIYNKEQVIKKFEVPPELMIDYLSLIGDSVDNIPGIPKVGPKTAVKWLHSYQSLDNLIQHADEITGKVGQYLRDNLSLLPLYKELVTIKTDVKLNVSLQDDLEFFTLKNPDKEALKELYTELEFKTWLQILNKPAPIVTTHSRAPHYETLSTQSQFEHWLLILQKTPLFAFNTHTTDVHYMSAEVVGISFATTQHQATYVSFNDQLPRDFVLEKLKPLLEDPAKLKIGHNFKYDLEVLANHNIHLNGITYDTLLESYIVNSTAGLHTLEALSKRLLHYQTTPEVAERAALALQLHDILWPDLCASPKQQHVFQTIEMPLIRVLARMERTGVLIDVPTLQHQGIVLEKRIHELETDIFSYADQTFNINSPQQLQEILFTKLGFPTVEKTPTGQPSTSESVLQELALTYPLPKLILEYRSMTKLKSTYIDALPIQINSQTGRIHTSYQQAITTTGRLSCTHPNLQNIPIRSIEGRKIRSAFIASSGKKIVSADYSQMELRIMAHLAEDSGLQHAFAQGMDIHTSTASGIFGIPMSQVTTQQRSEAKAINFGLMYGMSVFGLAKQLGIAQKEAQKTVERYFSCFPGVKIFMEKTKHEAFELGYVETIMGRRLYLPELKSHNMSIRRGAERAAINAPMQGTNADIIKLAMIQIDEWITTEQLDIHMVMQVHDELVFEIHESLLDSAVAKIQKIMENVIQLSVKLEVNIGIGDNWEAAH